MSEHSGSERADDAVERAASNPAVVGVAWGLVTIPLAYGVVETAIRVAALF